MRLAVLSPARLVPLIVTTVAATTLVPVLLASAPTAAAAATLPPGASNTGVPDGTTLQVLTGLVVLNVPGKVYSNLDIHGRVRVDAPNVTLANSIVRGDNSAVQGGLINAGNDRVDHHNFLLRDSTLSASYHSAWQNGIMGHDFTVVRTEITGTVDGIDVIGAGNVQVQRSWLHDFTYYTAAQSPLHKDTHNDGVQVLSGGNILIAGNTIANAHNSALQVSQDTGATTGVKFTGNWSSGGGCTVNMVAQPLATMSGMTITGNLFLHNTAAPNCAIIWGRGVTVSYSGNVWGDTGQPVVASRGY